MFTSIFITLRHHSKIHISCIDDYLISFILYCFVWQIVLEFNYVVLIIIFIPLIFTSQTAYLYMLERQTGKLHKTAFLIYK